MSEERAMFVTVENATRRSVEFNGRDADGKNYRLTLGSSLDARLFEGPFEFGNPKKARDPETDVEDEKGFIKNPACHVPVGVWRILRKSPIVERMAEAKPPELRVSRPFAR